MRIELVAERRELRQLGGRAGVDQLALLAELPAPREAQLEEGHVDAQDERIVERRRVAAPTRSLEVVQRGFAVRRAPVGVDEIKEQVRDSGREHRRNQGTATR